VTSFNVNAIIRVVEYRKTSLFRDAAERKMPLVTQKRQEYFRSADCGPGIRGYIQGALHAAANSHDEITPDGAGRVRVSPLLAEVLRWYQAADPTLKDLVVIAREPTAPSKSDEAISTSVLLDHVKKDQHLWVGRRYGYLEGFLSEADTNYDTMIDGSESQKLEPALRSAYERLRIGLDLSHPDIARKHVDALLGDGAHLSSAFLRVVSGGLVPDEVLKAVVPRIAQGANAAENLHLILKAMLFPTPDRFSTNARRGTIEGAITALGRLDNAQASKVLGQIASWGQLPSGSLGEGGLLYDNARFPFAHKAMRLLLQRGDQATADAIFGYLDSTLLGKEWWPPTTGTLTSFLDHWKTLRDPKFSARVKSLYDVHKQRHPSHVLTQVLSRYL